MAGSRDKCGSDFGRVYTRGSCDGGKTNHREQGGTDDTEAHPQQAIDELGRGSDNGKNQDANRFHTWNLRFKMILRKFGRKYMEYVSLTAWRKGRHRLLTPARS